MGPKVEKNQSRLSQVEDELYYLLHDIKDTRDTGIAGSESPQKLKLFKARLSRLDSRYEKFMESIREAKSLAEKIDGESISRFDDLRMEARNVYYEALALGMEEETAAISQSVNERNNAMGLESRIKLPTINLPTFDGQISYWMSFKDTFESLIHYNPILSQIQKFHYLKSSLKGTALQSISAIMTTADGYQQAWATLVQKYDNKRIHAINDLVNIFNFRPISKCDYRSLEQFSEVVLESATAFRNINLEDPSGFVLLTFCLRLLDVKTRERFESEFCLSSRIPTFDDFSHFIHRQCIQLQTDTLTSSFGANVQISSPQRNQNMTRRVLMSMDGSMTDNLCGLCNGKHRLYRCQRFCSMEPRQRYDQILPLNVCFNCLSPGHYANRYNSPNSCKQCKRRHHTLLHFSISNFSISRTNSPSAKVSNISASPENNNTSSSEVEAGSENMTVNFSSKIEDSKGSVLSTSSQPSVSVLLGTAMARIRDRDGRYLPIRVLIDSGSQRSFISLACAQSLDLQRSVNHQSLSGFGDNPIKGGKFQASCSLVPQKSPHPLIKTNAVIIPKITDKIPSCPIPIGVQKHFRKYQLADETFGKPGPIDFLLGADLFSQILAGECVRHEGYPSALKTIFGYVLMGPVGSNLGVKNSISLITSCQSPLPNDLYHSIEKFWEIETVPQVVKMNPEHIEAEEHFRLTHSRNPQGRYMVRLPFKTSTPPDFGNQHPTALNRFFKLENRLNKSQTLKESYCNTIKEHLEANYISPAINQAKYILPHHCVMKDNSPSKIRVVFDASFGTERGSLNDHLITGPKLQSDIRHVLLKFRQFPYVMSSDICQMYLQILMHPDDVSYQHFMFRFEPSEPVVEYQLNRLTFGLSCSPFLAMRVIHQLVSDEGATYPKASVALKDNIYVDDILTGANTIEEALKLQNELVELLNKGGFTLKKWMSNIPELLHTLTDNQQETLKFSESNNQSVKLLGMQWDPVGDCLSYNIQSFKLILTKRGIMSAVARMYDPLGYLAPVIFKAKSYLQQLWSFKDLNWDSPIPLAISREYEEFFNSLSILCSIQIPRCVFPQNPTHVALVGFSDASEIGYAANIYLRVQYSDCHIETHLIISKTRLAPLKTISIPRLELCAALLLAQTRKSISEVTEQFAVNSNYFFSDSTIVLSWLRLSPHTLKTFVANLVTNILELTGATDWYHVSSKDNPADLASRGSLPNDLLTNKLWWPGPEWLKSNFSDWPEIDRFEPVSVPERKLDAYVLTSQGTYIHLIQIMERISSFGKLCRIFAYIIRFVRNLKVTLIERTFGPLTLKENHEGTMLLVRCVQQHYFPLDLSMLTKNLHRLSPFLDSQGILRVGGRLKNSPLPYGAKHPILLPGTAHFTKLLIDHYHRTYLHPGPQLLQALILRNYWIVSARQIIRARVHKCVTCHRFRAKNFSPLMSDLPPSRFEQGRPFVVTGIDYAGPFVTKESGLRKGAKLKSYVCLFVCLSTRAVHLEVVTQLTTEAFIACLNRFVSRRGLPSKILSDRGTNFVGANRYLQELYIWLSQNTNNKIIKSHLYELKIKWEFIPPSAPHFGGIWEAGVKSFKYHFFRVVGNNVLTIEEFNTLVIRIEAVLNSRRLKKCL